MVYFTACLLSCYFFISLSILFAVCLFHECSNFCLPGNHYLSLTQFQMLSYSKVERRGRTPAWTTSVERSRRTGNIVRLEEPDMWCRLYSHYTSVLSLLSSVAVQWSQSHFPEPETLQRTTSIGKLSSASSRS